MYSKVEPIDKNVSNVEIAVPWGKIAGKLWGNNKSKQPILALHGWQDNAASFDNLAPLLEKHGPILALDLPGHGFSSWLPPGQMYFEIVYLVLLCRLKRYFGWEKLKLLAHSLSAYLVKGILEFLAIDERKNDPPSYRKEDLIKKWISATRYSLDETTCKVLMTRGVTEKPDGTVYLNRDPRLRVLPVHAGTHHVHLMNAPAVANAMDSFLEKHN
ncbi:hypothetical protein KPH14_005756 [Odynerus spinipes]|uniref:AB hydrolase-1 domain-containing protein n=1 Tax=Odynerus spinipes TaxID=1348599 RepID=A0AAD9RB22_9HYME|nr:hypothetical protein KPH14_005756 [Odynerus spinipes]